MELIPINEDNYRECVRLKIKDEQTKYMSSSNAYALAKAYVFRDCSYPYAIYENEIMIGFVYYREMPNLGNYLIEKIMIKDDYQSKGFGRQAMELIINKLKTENKYQKLCLCCDVRNYIALEMYKNLGFRQTENEEEHEIVLGIEW